MPAIEVVLGDITTQDVDAIVTGVYGFPPNQAAKIAVDTIGSTPTTVELVRLVAFDEPTRDILRAALSL
jgi:O-acetyl-ADP-ribose deacetylase (regulator of RNase III)